ncbi:hypothetical protein ABD87_14915 [Lysinibacillus sphaericus]|uniref:hypothetical protein n=1 Tax=Lysinibacillus sphaericus TaxID=1421 RepID=UPI0018CE5E3B|nr:hypothetical protein [Lysinibacillus sphaericus]MBG9730785.1 hypothetical protein [Lysinibacillus sphaericus]
MNNIATLTRVQTWEDFHLFLKTFLNYHSELQDQLTGYPALSYQLSYKSEANRAVLIGHRMKTFVLLCEDFICLHREQLHESVLSYWCSLNKFLEFAEQGIEKEVALALTLELIRLLRLAIPK